MKLGLNDISISDVRSVLGTETYKVSELCTHPNINKYSERKPINYPKTSGLTPTEFKGHISDIINGIAYGLQVGVGGSENMLDLHNANWEYKGRPVDNFRLGDFRGYNSLAKININGYVNLSNDTIFSDMINPISCEIIYSDNSINDGVRIQDILDALSGSLFDIGDYYPCVIIDNWIRVMVNSQTDSITRIKVGDTLYQRFYVPDIPSALHSKENVTVTFFLVKTIYREGLYDYRDWYLVQEDVVSGESAYTIPEMVGLNFQIASSELQGISKIKLTGVSYISTQNNLSVSFKWVDNRPTELTYYRFDVQMAGIRVSKTISISGGIVPIPTFSLDEFGIIGGTNTQYDVRASVYGSLDNNDFKYIDSITTKLTI